MKDKKQKQIQELKIQRATALKKVKSFLKVAKILDDQIKAISNDSIPT